MELPPWFKIKNLIGSLNLSGWFKSWFNRENQNKIDSAVHIHKVENLNLQIFYDKNPTAKKVSDDEVPIPENNLGENIEVDFSFQQKFIVYSINQVHSLNGLTYDFKEDYEFALEHIKYKKSRDWFTTVAQHLANAIQTGDAPLGIEIFFNSFESETDLGKQAEFNNLKENVKYCYKRLQNLRHGDKDGGFRKSLGKTEITSEDCEKIFSEFQSLFLDLFMKYRIKRIL